MASSREAERDAWLVLAAVEGVGPRTLSALVGAAGGAAAVLTRAGRGDWRWLPPELPLAPQLRARLHAAHRPAPFAALAARMGLWMLTPLDASYPARLGVLPDPPAVLFGRGSPEALRGEAAVAIVGTRHPTLLGRALASDVAALMAGCGAVIVSGLAIGIDGAAHAAALRAGGTTVAVIGAGHGHGGPRAHRALEAAIVAQGGAVISELAPATPPTRGTYPRRNRLLSALSDAVAVIEAPARSGALNTAHHALEQGRPLFVAPGRPSDPATAGCLRLLRETEARVLTGPLELLEDLGLSVAPVRAARGSPGEPAGRAAALAGLRGGERLVAAALCEAPAGLDRLVERTGLEPGAVSGSLALLQLRGWVQAIDGTFLVAGVLSHP
ncbi:MAG TPA: DNA-processing protein DprA [Candidatus Dormibacteraeota bacterium]|nr:DNA-processing protein DprA [Candidatus Dormibacteraeota bacterium]